MGTVKVTQENLDSLVEAINNREKTTEVDGKLATKQAYDANIVIDPNYVHTDNNYTTTEKSKLANIEAGANKYVKPLSEAISYITNLQVELDKRVNKEAGKSLVTDTVLTKLLSDVNALEELVNSDDTTLDTVQEIVDFISINRSTLEALSIGSIAGLQNALNGKVDDSQVLTNVPANAKFTDTNTWRGIHDSPVNGATTTSISSNWAFDSVKTPVPANAKFTDTVYSHPSTHPATMITTTDEFAYSNSTNVQDVLDDLDQAIANVNAKDPVITLTGDVTGSGTMTNLGNVSINATVADDSHNHVWGNIDGASVSSLAGPRFSTSSGYIEFGPANSSHAHIYTDRPNFYFNKDLLVNGSKVWHAGNDGSGSGLDADKLDGKHLSEIISDISGGASAAFDTLKEIQSEIESNDLEISQWLDTNTWRPVVDNLTSTSTTNSLSAKQGKELKTLVDGKLGKNEKAADADKLDGLNSSQFLRSDTSDTMNGDLTFGSGDNIHRSTHSSGYLVGSYNSVGSNDGKSNPIYTIGSSYQPTDTDLGNMYGIGFGHGNAKFDGINSMLSGWGLYVAADGDARIGLDASSGIIRSTGVAYVNTNQRVFADDYHPNADKWTTARTLSLTGDVSGSANFDGSGNVSITATVGNDSHTHSRIYDEGGSGNNLRVSSSNEIEFFNSSGTISDMYLNYNGSAGSVRGPGGATMLHTSNYNSYAPTKTGTGASGTWGINVTGNAATATKLATARNIALSGDVTGSANFDGSGNVSIGATVANDSHWHSQVYIPDTRGAVRAPSYYPDRYVSYDFQNKADTGAGDDEWHVLQTVAKWSSFNASHSQQQIAYTGSNLKHREATSDTAWGGWKKIWDSGNDGSGSGLDADLLDGQHASAFASASHTHSYLPLTGGTLTGVLNANAGISQDGFAILNGSDTWLRTAGQTGWYNATYGGGWYMTDTTYVRTYNNKSIYTGGTLVEASDARLKENIQPITNALSKVTSLQGVHYNKIETPELEEIGFIAQEVEKVVPEIVTTDDTEEGMKAVSYARTVALLVEAMKEQMEVINNLNNRIKLLEEK